MTHTKILPDITVSSLTPRKKRFFLKYLARFLLLFENIRPVGSFLDNKRVVLVAAPHQSGKDEYLMILIILALDVDVCYLSAKWTMRRIPNPFEKSKDIDDQGIRWPLGWLQETIFRDRKSTRVIEELKKRDSFLLIVTPEGRFDATRFRTSFLFIAKELNAEVMPVQIDYENEIFNILESFNIEGDTESVVKNLRLKFDGIKGKKSRFKA